MSPRPSSKAFMLNAAGAIVLESGARHLTLDAVASRAGVSKGGVLYHFPTKEALLRAMLEGLGKQLDEAWKKKCKGLKEGPGREIRAFILSFADRNSDQDQIGSALLAAVAHDPRLLQPAREETRRRLSKMLQSGMSFERAAVIFFAVQGLTLMELLSLSPLSVKERKGLVGQLLRLADERNTE